MTNFTNSNLQGEDRQKSKASAPGRARHEPTWTY
ncbi:putative exported domain protein [Yersinia enterocolitica]|nr:putative exported domain protein [Yersinia enterocolitica]